MTVDPNRPTGEYMIRGPFATREDFDANPCPCGRNCPTSIHPPCHPDAALEAHYDHQMGCLVLQCARCERTILPVAVSDHAHALGVQENAPGGQADQGLMFIEPTNTKPL